MSLGHEPVDPRYVRFRDGWATLIIGKPQYLGLRWAPWVDEGGWHTWDMNKWDYIDIGVVGPKSPLGYRWQPGERLGYIWEWADRGIGDSKLPDLWTEINVTFARVKVHRPYAVWNPYDGSWREIRERKPAPAPEPSPGPEPLPPNRELERRIDELYQLHRDRKITDEILKQRLLELMREYG